MAAAQLGGNAHFLLMLATCRAGLTTSTTMVAPTLLRLCFATPRRWLEDGNEIVVERAPTQFATFPSGSSPN